MKDLFDYQFEILIKEYDALQANIRNYDDILFRIKGWAITIFSGIVLLTLKERRPEYLILGAFGVILFWLLDGIFKGFQRAFIVRYNKLEHFLRRSEFQKAVEGRAFKKFSIPDITGRVSVKDRDKKINPLKASLYWHTSILYISMLVILACIGIWIFLR